MSNPSVTLVIKDDIKTAPLTIKINCAVAKGYFIGHAFVRSKDESKEMQDRLESGFYEDDDGKFNDERFLKDLYEKFDGLPGDDGWREVLQGKASAYLIPSCVQAYFEQYGEAKRGNFDQRRRR